MKKFPLLSLSLALASTTLLHATCEAQQNLTFPTISLNAGIHVIKAEVASTNAQREQGLMFREKLGPNEGMDFLFGAPAGVCMWMKNTLVALSVAFIDENGKIVNIEEMKAQTLNSHCAKKTVPYALEMASGWFKEKNIKPGSTIDGLPGQK